MWTRLFKCANTCWRVWNNQSSGKRKGFVHTYTLILTAKGRLFLRSHATPFRQSRRSSDVTEARGRRCSFAIKSTRLGAGEQLIEPDQRHSSLTLNKTNMVKITFQPVSAQKPEKDVDGDKIIIPQADVSLSGLLLLYFTLLELYAVVSVCSVYCNLNCIVCACVILWVIGILSH